MSAVMELKNGLLRAAFELGRWTESVDQLHSCDSSLRHPWPPDPNCTACVRHIERFVEMHHLEMSYRLFGFDAMVDHYEQYIDRRVEMARTRREMGSGI